LSLGFGNHARALQQWRYPASGRGSLDDARQTDTEVHSTPEAATDVDAAPSTAGQDPGWSQTAIIAAVLLFAVALGLMLFIIRTRTDETGLSAARMTLVLNYPITSEPTAMMEGQPEAAPAGARISCRTTAQPHLLLGESVANADGSFAVTLDASPWPLESLGSNLYQQLNGSIECRSGNSSWVRPLRPPRVSVA
jgi:hypothetical protein